LVAVFPALFVAIFFAFLDARRRPEAFPARRFLLRDRPISVP
jgi:hypothetical protein